MSVLTRPGKVVKFVTLPLTALAASWQNTTGGAIYILDAFLDITTAEGGASTIDAGVSATDASADTLLDGANGNSATVQNNIDAKGTNGGRTVKCAANYFVTCNLKTGTAATAKGTFTFSYVKA